MVPLSRHLNCFFYFFLVDWVAVVPTVPLTRGMVTEAPVVLADAPRYLSVFASGPRVTVLEQPAKTRTAVNNNSDFLIMLIIL